MAKQPQDWQVGEEKATNLTLTTVRRDTGTGELHIYIEGDGHAYISKGTVSGDPTPLNPVALELALKDPANTVYIARPCQWSRGPERPRECFDSTLWTTQRFTEAMAQRYAALIVKLSAGRPVVVVGYSGGGWLALQAGARLPNVSKVITIAGNMAPNYVNQANHVTQMDVAPYPSGRLQTLPITAYTGTQDTLITPDVVDAFRTQTGAQNVWVVPYAASHSKGWETLKLNFQ